MAAEPGNPYEQFGDGTSGIDSARLATIGALEQEWDRATRIAQAARDLAQLIGEQASLVESVYQHGFLNDLAAANGLATDIASGNLARVKFDQQSLREHGDDPETVRHYLRNFGIQDPNKQYNFPRITFGATAVIPYGGVEHFVDHGFYTNPLTKYNFSPSFHANVPLPTLLDPRQYTFGQLTELQVVDPGHAEQVKEAYRMAARAQKNNDPRATFTDPLIVRMATVLPTGYDYKTDFLPLVDIPQGKGPQSWDPYLIVNGELNPSGRFLSSATILGNRAVVYDDNGREAALRVSRPLPGQVAEEQDRSLMPLANHEMNRMAIVLFPYNFEPITQSSSFGWGATEYSSSGMYRGAGPTKGPNVGGAMVESGARGWVSTGKSSGNFEGKFVPCTGARPVVYLVRLLTAQRDPDQV